MVEIWQANARAAAGIRRRGGRSARGGFPASAARHGGRRAVRVRHGEARARAVARRRPAGAARRRRRVRARAPEARRDAALLPRRGGGQRSGSGALVARRRRSARRSSPSRRTAASASTSACRGRRRRHSSRCDARSRPVRPRRHARRRLGPGVARGDARRGAGARARRRDGGDRPRRRRRGDRRRVLRRDVRLGRAARPRAGGPGTRPSRSSARSSRASGTTHARWVHLGATSQDIMDTAAMLVSPGGARARARATSTATPTPCATLARRAPGHADGRADAPPARRPDDVRAQGCGLARRACSTRARAFATCAAGLTAQLGGAAGTLSALGDRGPELAALYAAELDLRGADAAVAREPRADRRARRGARDRVPA